MLLGKSSDRKIPWIQLAIEAALVVFSVLLALGIKSYRESQVQEQLADRALHNLRYEIEENKKAIKEVISYHKNMLDSLKSENPPTGISIRSATIQNNAWQAVQSTGAVSYIDFSIIEIASSIEEKQRQYQSFVETTIQIGIDRTFNANELERERTVAGLRLIIHGLYSLESQLLTQYETALQRLESKDISE